MMRTGGLLIALLGAVGCGGAVGGDAPDRDPAPTAARAPLDAGMDAAPSPQAGCFAGEQLGCSTADGGAIVGAWCWSTPADVPPAPSCVPFPRAPAASTAYWCCP